MDQVTQRWPFSIFADAFLSRGIRDSQKSKSRRWAVLEKKPQEAPGRTLARSRMLKRAASFQRVYRLGKSYAGRHLVLYVFRVRAGEKKLKGEVGFAAGKKLGCAVRRVRVKRLLRECYRLHQAELAEHLALVLVGRKAAVTAKRQEVEKCYLSLCRRAGILKGTQS
jgi:ribonuclease P protein component